MRLLKVVIVWAVIGSSSAYAKEYGSYDVRRILTVTETSSGKRHGIDMPYLDLMLNDLAAHARNYPPNFDSDQDRQRAIRDTGMLSGMLDILVNGPNPQPEILFRAASVNSFGHNLNIPGAAEKASSIYQRLLAISPDHPRTNHSYGMFLAGTARLRESIPYLEKALAAGTVDAGYALGMVHLGLGDKEQALKYLESYKARAAAGADVSKLIEAIRSGKAEIKREGK
jgi:tetratricopeptide (TPR) repeat protein